MEGFVLRVLLRGLLLVGWWETACQGVSALTSCSINDVHSLQSAGVVMGPEQLDGHWFVTHVYTQDGVIPAISPYTVDVVSTLSGITLYMTSNFSADTSCDYQAMELQTTQQAFRYTTVAISDVPPRTVVVVGAATVPTAQEEQRALLYTCSGDATLQQPCTGAVALVVGRQPNVTAAAAWLGSLTNASLPCFDALPVVVSHQRECPLKPFWGLAGRNCDVRQFPVQQNFDLTKYVSRIWYEMSWLVPFYYAPNELFRDYHHDYKLQPDGNVTAYISGRDPSNDTCFFYHIDLTTTAVPGRLYFHAPDTEPSPYNVVETDYDHYALVFGCGNMTSAGVCSEGRAWLWSRDKTLERRYRLQVYSRMQDLCLNPTAFLATQHTKECNQDASGSTSVQYAVALTSMLCLSALVLTSS